MRTLVAAIAMVGLAARAQAAEPIDLDLAARYFAEARQLWKADAGKLWGTSLESPLIFADRKTRRVVASQADREGKLRAEHGVFVGELPPTVGIANYSVEWAGVRWTMVAWPLPKDRADRAALMMHESWHRVQDKLGFPSTGPRNDHLDKLDGRFWLQLEWRALAAALGQSGEKRLAAVEDALLFRAFRRSRFKGAAEDERLLEMHEGLAEYTGVRLSGLSEKEREVFVIKKLEQRPDELPSFTRSFGYLSGPAYGLLLDAVAPEWRARLTKDNDLGELLAAALKLKSPNVDRNELQKRADRYRGEQLRTAEQARDEKVQKRQARYRALLVDGPRLILPLEKMQMSFDPDAVQPIDGVGSVYPTIRIVDVWGILSVSDGALLDKDFRKAYVAAPTEPKARPLKEKTWELQLNEGWKLESSDRKGDFRLVKDAK